MTESTERTRRVTSAARRSHPKSKSGCKTCKSRKIKCDERKPACRNCSKHNVQCDFITAAPEQRLPPGVGPSLDLNLDHLELLHNYTTSTYATLSESLILRDFYRVTAVQLGLKCDYIMRALLAVSSLQLAHYRPQMREHYQALAMQHYRIASSVAIDLMQDVSSATAQNMFLFSVLAIFYAFGCPRGGDGILLVGESAYPDWMFLYQGTSAFTDLLSIEGDGPLAPVFSHGKVCWDARQAQRDPTSPVYQHLDRLRALIADRETDQGLRDIYTRAISELRKSFLVFEGENGRSYDVTDLFVWVAEVAHDFLPLLRAPTQEAVTIFAFFCVLLKGLRNQWWLHGWADHLIARSYNLLDREHQLWIQWPLEELGYVP